jgi:hypothetical protein
MQRAHGAEIGAIGLDGQMIDAPMIKQVGCVSLRPSLLLSAEVDEYSRHRILLILLKLLV